MADQKQSQEFLGGGPKFNSVGRGNPSPADAEEPVVLVVQTGYWLRVSAIVAVIILLAGTLLFLSDRTPGKVTATPSHGGHVAAPDPNSAVQPDPNFK